METSSQVVGATFQSHCKPDEIDKTLLKDQKSFLLSHSLSTVSGRTSSTESDVSRVSLDDTAYYPSPSPPRHESKCSLIHSESRNGDSRDCHDVANNLQINKPRGLPPHRWDASAMQGLSLRSDKVYNFAVSDRGHLPQGKNSLGDRVDQPISKGEGDQREDTTTVTNHKSSESLLDVTEEEKHMLELLGQQVDRGLFYQLPSRTENNFKGQKQGLRIKYNHYENPAIFIAILTQLMTRRPIGTTPQHSVFLRQSSDPNLECSYLVDRLASGMRCKYSCYVLAIMYIIKLTKHGLPITCETFQRLACAAIVVAVKFYDDLYYSNEHYASELGFSLETLNKLEESVLLLLDFDLKVSTVDFSNAMAQFDQFRASCCKSRGSPIWCGLRTSEVSCSTSLIRLASLFNVVGTEKASRAVRLDSQNARVLERHLKSREQAGSRFETEEENLYKSAVMSQMKDIKKLVNQFQAARTHTSAIKNKEASHSQISSTSNNIQRFISLRGDEPQRKSWHKPTSKMPYHNNHHHLHNNQQSHIHPPPITCRSNAPGESEMAAMYVPTRFPAANSRSL